MSFGLTLTAPSDLSVGRVQITRDGAEVGAWVASPGEMQHTFDGLEAGIYKATAEPLGQPSRSFLFFMPDRDEQVSMPSLQTMGSWEFALANAASLLRGAVDVTTGPLWDDGGAKSLPASDLAAAHPVALGLSECTDFKTGDSLVPYLAGSAPDITLIDGGVQAVLKEPSTGIDEAAGRLILSWVVSGVPDHAIRLPYFQKGVQVICMASPLGAADLSVRIVPVERDRRAIIQALFAGSSQETAAVLRTLPGGTDPIPGLGDWQVDPWTAVAAALLCFRFPDVAPDKLPLDLPAAAARFPWLPDIHVLQARERLRLASRADLTPEAREAALADALECLARANDAGPPFFAYAAQLATEMLSALADHAEHGAAVASQLAMRNRWPSSHGAGASYAWIATGEPSTRGTIDTRYAAVFFSGRVNYDRILLDTRSVAASRPTLSEAVATIASPLVGALVGSVTNRPYLGAAAERLTTSLPTIARSVARAPWADVLQGVGGLVSALPIVRKLRKTEHDAYLPTETNVSSPAPALSRPVIVADDPNKGRFGGEASREGFTLVAQFTGANDATSVGIALAVIGSDTFESYDEMAEFFLHPTFRPSRIGATFRGRRAELRIVSLGGFTVGVWLPTRAIELELDLALLPDAPRIVREL